MSIIDMGITYDEFENAPAEKTGFKPIEPGDYEVVIESLTERMAQTGRPMLAARFSIINHPTYTNRKLFRDMPLAYTDGQGNRITSGTGILASMCKSAGVMWEGTALDASELIGLSLMVRVKVVPVVKNGVVTENLKNEISRFLP